MAASGRSKRTASVTLVIVGCLIVAGISVFAVATGGDNADPHGDPTGTTTSSTSPANSTTHSSDSRCPPGEHWVDQGDGPQAYRGCLKEGDVAKPIVYLYPTKTTDITVRLSRPEALTAQYPTYGSKWTVTAEPDGTLHEKASGRELYALYYESTTVSPATMRADGFVIRGNETASFLEDALPALGLNPREAQEFIVYWLPVLQKSPYVYLRFQTPAEIDENQRLSISPEPETIIRVVMTYRPLDAPVHVTPQKLTPPVRKGFTVVEWGGTRIDY